MARKVKSERQPELFPDAIPPGALPREKTSFSLSVEAKYKLTTLKAGLRRHGYRATESSIVEALLQGATLDDSLVEAVTQLQSPPRLAKQAV